MRQLKRIHRCLTAILVWALTTGNMVMAQPSFRAKMQDQKTAVVVVVLNDLARPFKKNALSRIEGILFDNAIEVLDQEKAEELKDVFKTLDDPGAFVTAETFVENAEKFAIKGLIAVYLNVDIVKGLAGYYTATAQADVRFIDEADARVESLVTIPMGSPGRPPSDGLTQNSAAINAVQRAVDDACVKLGLELLDPATPRSVRLSLEGPISVPSASNLKRTSESDVSLSKYAILEKQKWRGEEVTCTAKDPAGALGAVGGYIIDTDFRRRPQRLYGSRIHLIDIHAKKEITTFDCHAVEKKSNREKGTYQILDCMFVQNWRYLSAVTGNNLFLWDTERGSLQASVALQKPIKSVTLSLHSENDKNYLVLDTGLKQIAYQIVRKK